jgi:hypothetical protein
VDRK